MFPIGSSSLLVVEPVDPFERGELDRLEVAPRPAPPDHFGFVESVDRLGERVVVAVADAADGRLDAGVLQALRVFDRDILHAAIASDARGRRRSGPTFAQGLLERVEHEARMRRARGAPADDPLARRCR